MAFWELEFYPDLLFSLWAPSWPRPLLEMI